MVYFCLLQELNAIGFGENIQLITQEIPVNYNIVSSLVPKLWKKYKPKVIKNSMFFIQLVRRREMTDPAISKAARSYIQLQVDNVHLDS